MPIGHPLTLMARPLSPLSMSIAVAPGTIALNETKTFLEYIRTWSDLIPTAGDPFLCRIQMGTRLSDLIRVYRSFYLELVCN